MCSSWRSSSQHAISPGHNAFKAAGLDAFVAEIEQEGDLRVIIVRPSRDNQED